MRKGRRFSFDYDFPGVVGCYVSTLVFGGFFSGRQKGWSLVSVQPGRLSMASISSFVCDFSLLLSCLLVLSIHGHALAGKDVREGAFMSELAVALHEPGADFFLTGLYRGVGEGAGSSNST